MYFAVYYTSKINVFSVSNTILFYYGAIKWIFFAQYEVIESTL